MNAPAPRHWKKIGLLVFGWLCVGLGFVGVFLPVLPTTPFLLLALWAFARSSERFHAWVLHHRLLGPYVADWERDGIIPVRAKIISLAAMTLSLAWVIFFTAAPWYGIAAMAGIMAYGAWFILTKPSHRPR